MRIKLKAELVSFSEVKVYVPKAYFGGQSKTFILKNKNFKDKLIVLNKYDFYDSVCYHCALDNVEIDFSKEYYIEEEHGQNATLEFNDVVHSAEFENMFYYDGKDLGNTYSPEHTKFKVWAPTANKVDIRVKLKHNIQIIPMIRLAKGVWEVTLEGDYEYAEYTYMVKTGGKWNESIDPYAYASTPNHRKSVVISLAKAHVALNHELLPEFKSFTDAIIYETSVRDISAANNSNIINRGKFLGVVEQGTKTQNNKTTGLDYFKELGITHLQLLPVYDFGSIDEYYQWDAYNWGYDPVQYNVPEGTYATELTDPYSRIVDLKKMIASLHAHGLRVVMDVVYNHVYDREESSFEKIVPNYYFRKDSNGSFCGNDFASDRLMVRSFIVDSVLRWAKFYGMDGFRFDLMGILDIQTMNIIRKELNKVNPMIMVYGEGWNMPTALADSKKAMMTNWFKLGNIGFFNDRFRDIIKGPTSNDEVHIRGLIGSNTTNISKVIPLVQGSCVEQNGIRMFGEPHHTINYLECHDNHTLFDRIRLSNPHEDEQKTRLRMRLGMSFVLLSQGIPFIHAGQEFNQTKFFEHNSYNLADKFNQIDWLRKDECLEDVEYTKDLIKLRKTHKIFSLETRDEIEQHIETSEYNGLVSMKYKNGSYYNGFENYQVYFNVTEHEIYLDTKEGYQVLFDDKGLVTKPQSVDTNHKILPLSVLVIAK